jgi:hypothetical protein
MSPPEAPVSWGELIDKVTILEIKRKRLKRPEALADVAKELSLPSALADGAIADRADVMSLKRRLAAVNEDLWDIEDRIRLEEAARTFDEGFIELARSVYKRNDERAAIKRTINLALSSELIEEKSYSKH